MRILVTGGAGYIGSHTVVRLCAEGHDVVIVDNYANSSPVVIDRLAQIVGRDVEAHRLDLVTDVGALDDLFSARPIDAVIHFAGLKAVGESVADPLAYYRTNIDATLTLLEVMSRHACRVLCFSSSATVYGEAALTAEAPFDEGTPLGSVNPYGRTKLVIEGILRDLAAADPTWRIALLRYFNPVGAHPSGLIGEDPQGTPNNLMPYVAQVAVGRRPQLTVHGDDYPTPDGTCLRDYIHVDDLAAGHVAAIDALLASGGGVHAWNLGTGRGTSVLELVHAFERESGRPVPYVVGPRRPGDVAELYADPTRAQRDLGWRAERDLADICRDQWRWQSVNPAGYANVDSPEAGLDARLP